MTQSERKAVAVFVAFLSLASQKQSGLNYLYSVLADLGVSDKEMMQCMSGGMDNKYEMYRTLRNMNPQDKKRAQQYFAKAAMTDGSAQSMGILNEIFEECEMFDSIV